MDESLPEAEWLVEFDSWWPELTKQVPGITIDITEAGVTLGGEVRSPERLREAEALARRIWGSRVIMREMPVVP